MPATALHLAAKAGELDEAQKFMGNEENKARVNEVDSTGWTGTVVLAPPAQKTTRGLIAGQLHPAGFHAYRGKEPLFALTTPPPACSAPLGRLPWPRASGGVLAGKQGRRHHRHRR